jgi:CheY-like chemotaxis protein
MMKALVVEDDLRWQSALVSAVTAAGFEPVLSQEATNAALMLEHVLDIRLVILDWNLIAPGDLPSATGEGIAAIAQTKNIPIIVVSGALDDPDFLEQAQIEYPMDESHRLRSQYGVSDWLQKKRLEKELHLSPPLPTLISRIEKLKRSTVQASAQSLVLSAPIHSPKANSPRLIPPYTLAFNASQDPTCAFVGSKSNPRAEKIQITHPGDVSFLFALFKDNYACVSEDQVKRIYDGDAQTLSKATVRIDSFITKLEKKGICRQDREKLFTRCENGWMLGVLEENIE